MKSAQPVFFRTVYLNGKQSRSTKDHGLHLVLLLHSYKTQERFRNFLNVIIHFKHPTDIKSIDTFDVLHLISFINSSSSICIVVRYFEVAGVIWGLLP